MNGVPELQARFVPPQSVGKFAYTSVDGGYMATITFDAASPAILYAAAEKFLAFAAEKAGKAGKVQPADASALASLRNS